MKIKLVNSRTGEIRFCKKNYIWWFLLAGNLYYLYKGMYKTFWRWCFIDLLVGLPTLGLSAIVTNIYKGFKFQEDFVNYYTEKGYDLVKEVE